MKKAAVGKNVMTGACGEFYIAAYLTRYGLIVALPRAGIPGSDLLVMSTSGRRSLGIQVKTGTDSLRTPKWTEKKEVYQWSTSVFIIETHHENLWYAFVWLKDWPKAEELPEVFFLPSSVVAERMLLERAEMEKNTKYWPYFWMLATEIEQFKGEKGLNKMFSELISG